jgi:hypothetical protein
VAGAVDVLVLPDDRRALQARLHRALASVVARRASFPEDGAGWKMAPAECRAAGLEPQVPRVVVLVAVGAGLRDGDSLLWRTRSFTRPTLCQAVP